MSEKPFRDITDADDRTINNQNDSESSTQNMHPTSSATGSGNNSMFSDQRGSWWGNQDPTKAAVYISMKGVLTIRASALNTATAIEFYDKDDNLSIFIGFEEGI